MEELINTSNEVEKEESKVIKTKVFGVVKNCFRLNLREKPVPGSKILDRIAEGTKLVVNLAESEEDFYKVTIKNSISGYCAREFIELK